MLNLLDTSDYHDAVRTAHDLAQIIKRRRPETREQVGDLQNIVTRSHHWLDELQRVRDGVQVLTQRNGGDGTHACDSDLASQVAEELNTLQAALEALGDLRHGWSIALTDSLCLVSAPKVTCTSDQTKSFGCTGAEVFRCALHTLPGIGVFFCREDSSEGSSIAWLAAPDYSPRKRQKWIVHQIMNGMVDKGLVVTDGSRCDGEHNPYKGFRQFFLNRTIGRRAVEQAEPFQDLEGRKFECVGYAGQGNGPTLIWQMSKK